MTAGEILTDARALMNDPVPTGETDGVRYANSTMLIALSAAQDRLFDLRPYCVLQEEDDSLTCQRPTRATSTSQTLEIAERWREALAQYTCYIMYTENSDEHEANPEGKAAACKKAFYQLVA